ncbi:MAG: GTP cyclohydrolase II [Bdellovibrionales bacterium]|nr:GTP cyclohydrolase II [Bdellovibrionales bacterium]
MAMINCSPVEDVIKAFKAGEPVIILDDPKRENEGDIAVAAELVTPEHISFMMKNARGLICASISPEIANRLNLPLQAPINSSLFNTPFAVSICEASESTSAVSARTRAKTIRALANPNSLPEDFNSPGCVFPLIAHPRGVLGRDGQTEGSYDLARLAGLKSAAVICEILNPDGTMARNKELQEFSKQHSCLITSVEDIKKYRLDHEVFIQVESKTTMQTKYGEFSVIVFMDEVEKKQHLALTIGDLKSDSSPLVRIHSECLTGDIFGSLRCDCGDQLDNSLKQIAEAKTGVLLYLRQEGRGIGLSNKLKAYSLQDLGHDTVEANIELGFKPDSRSFAAAAKLLEHLGVEKVRLLTNNPRKIDTLKRLGVEVVSREALIIPPNPFSKSYLETKREKLGHLL